MNRIKRRSLLSHFQQTDILKHEMVLQRVKKQNILLLSKYLSTYMSKFDINVLTSYMYLNTYICPTQDALK